MPASGNVVVGAGDVFDAKLPQDGGYSAVLMFAAKDRAVQIVMSSTGTFETQVSLNGSSYEVYRTSTASELFVMNVPAPFMRFRVVANAGAVGAWVGV